MTNNAKNEYEAIIQKETSEEEEEIQGIKDTLRLIPRRVELGAVVKKRCFRNTRGRTELHDEDTVHLWCDQ